MTRRIGMISLGSHKGHGFVAFAAALLGSLLIQPVSVHACGPQVTKDGFVAQRSFSPMMVLPGAAKARPSASNHDPASIVGLWYVVFVSGGQVFDTGYDQWHSDGTE